jgi:hypothetical protein
MLYDPKDAVVLCEIRRWVIGSKYDSLLDDYDTLKKEIEAAKRKEQKVRKTIERALREGIPLKRKC